MFTKMSPLVVAVGRNAFQIAPTLECIDCSDYDTERPVDYQAIACRKEDQNNKQQPDGADKKQALRPGDNFRIVSAEGYHADDKLGFMGFFGNYRIQQTRRRTILCFY